MNYFDQQLDLIRNRITAWLESSCPDLSKDDRKTLALHMTDWFSDYKKLKALLEHPGLATDDAVEKALDALGPASRHLAAAAKIYAGDNGDRE